MSAIHDERQDEVDEAVDPKLVRLLAEKVVGLPVNYTSPAAEVSALVSAGGGRLCGFSVYNGNAATRFLQFFDATVLPANGTVPTLVYPVQAGATFWLEYLRPRVFQRGIYVAKSTTATTLTVGSGADQLFDVQYV